MDIAMATVDPVWSCWGCKVVPVEKKNILQIPKTRAVRADAVVGRGVDMVREFSIYGIIHTSPRSEFISSRNSALPVIEAALYLPYLFFSPFLVNRCSLWLAAV